jgi:hypothetical protein
LPGKASDYKGYKVAPISSGVLNGKRTETAILGDWYPVEVEGTVLKTIIGPPNIKPTVTIKTDKSEIFRGESVKVTVEASASDSDLKSIKVKIPSLGKEETKSCGFKELGSCKFEIKSLTLPDAGDAVIEATAEDLVGGETGTSDKATATVKVKEKVNLVKGLNLIIVDGSLVKKGDLLVSFGGAYQCLSPEIGVLKSVSGTYKWERADFAYTVAATDVAISIYCAVTVQESYYDPYFDEW